jgi:hypothetical protein
MHKVLSAEKIYKFEEGYQRNVELRIEALRMFLSDFCVDESVPLPKEAFNNVQNETYLLFLNTIMLLQENRVLITEDWWQSSVLQGSILTVNTHEFLNLQ